MDDTHQGDNSPEAYRLSRRRLLAGFGGLVALGSISGATAALGGVAGAAPKTRQWRSAVTKGGNLVIDVQTEPQGYCPLEYPNASSVWISGQIMDSLYWYDDTGTFAPLLAAGAPTTTDGITWTIKLKPGVTFHNGDPFTADHVVATLLATGTAPTNIYNGQVGTIKSATAVDPQTVTFTLAAANYMIPHVLAVVPMCHKDFLTAETNIMGTGPFQWSSLVSGSHLTLNAYPKYHLGAPLLDSVTFQFVPDPDTRVVDALQGTADISLLPPFNDLNRLQSDKNLKLINSPGVVMLPLHVNVNSPAFKDVRVRQALGFAMNRTRVRDIAFAGKAQIFQGGVIPPVMRGFDPTNTYFPATPNLAKAKALLAAAGVKNVEFTAAVYAVPDAIAAFEVIQQDIKAAGFIANVETQPLAAFAATLTSHKFDLCVSYEFNGTWWAKDGINPLLNYLAGEFVNFVNYDDPAFDALLAKSRATQNQAEQTALWKQANRLLTVAAVNLIPVVPHLTGSQSTKVSGLPLAPLELDYLHLHKVSLA
jgi:peptide/nickel transport system substrate-binding protein